jgi:DNA-binding LacI/PurR family transcriptional regulator
MAKTSFSTRGPSTIPDELTKICRGSEFDGAILLWANPQTSQLQIIEDEKMPYIVFGRRVEHELASYVAPDNFGGAYALTQHLITAGHQRIGFMSRPIHGPINIDRLAGYTQALRDANIPLDDSLVIPTALEPNSGYHAMNALLDLAAPPTAVFAFYDLLAVDALRAASERGLRVPADIAIAGFDGLRSSMITTPAITTMKQPLQHMGKEAVKLLLQHIADRELPPSRMTYPVELIARSSTCLA